MKIRGLETILLKIPFSLSNMQKITIFSYKYTNNFSITLTMYLKLQCNGNSKLLFYRFQRYRVGLYSETVQHMRLV